MTRRLLAIGAALALSACGSRETAALDAEIARLRTERDKLAKVAEHLDEYKQEQKRLAEDLARTVESGVLLEHDQRVERAKTIPGLTTTSLGAGAGWQLTGASPETLRLLRAQCGALAVDRVDVTASGWNLKIPAYDQLGWVGASPTPGVHLAPPTPAPGRFSGARTWKLRTEIESLQNEVEQLERLTGPVAAFEKSRHELTVRLQLLDSPSRLVATVGLTSRLFLDDGAICRTGSLAVSRESVRLFCAPRGTDADAASEALRALFASGAGNAWRLGPLSIDASNPEPIQGSLTRVP